MERDLFSYYLPPFQNTDPDGDPVSLEEVWGYITGRAVLNVERRDRGVSYRIGTLQEVTEKVRRMTPEEYKDRQRGKGYYLPLVTFGGVFSKRSGDSLDRPSGLVCLDIDHLSSLGLDLEDLKRRLSEDREIGVRLVFTSPSGDGIKIICKTSGEIRDKESYKLQFNILNHFVSERYGVPIGETGLDKGISNIDRGCLLCYDPGAILQEWDSTFNPEDHPLPEETRIDRGTPLRDLYRYAEETGDGIEEIVRRVEESGRDFFPEYADYNPLVFAFASLGERGRDLLHRVCRFSTKYRPEETDRDFTDHLSRINAGTGFGDIGFFIKRVKSMGINVNDYNNKRGGLPYTPERSFQAVQKTPPQTSPEEEFGKYLNIPDLGETLSFKIEGIKTGYKFETGRGEEEFVLPSGSLSLICSQSSHGKTRFVENLALQISQSEGEGSVLFFVYEQTQGEILLQFANLYTDIPGLSQFKTPNIEVIQDYYKTGGLPRCPETKRKILSGKLEEFREIYSSGRLRVLYDPDLQTDRLCNLLKWISEKIPIKAVFVDYVQALYKEGFRKERREELREICRDLNNTAKTLQVPVILSAQLNRDTPNPSSMSSDNIAESADITRYADTILLFWNSVFVRDIKNRETYLQSKEYDLLKERGFVLGDPGKLYCILTKNRGGTPYIDAVLNYAPETGKITTEDLPSGEEESELGLIHA